ncbi:PREDICTED: odorant receptor 4-like [Papilio polytes]|uniref:odorant receptor 4-like n=1 Tax=Papilio polytes TaxID=76194 RepID=UPI0006765898|nr:PREDICTED: odorant receptor 4-like [Papilio polytes]
MSEATFLNKTLRRLNLIFLAIGINLEHKKCNRLTKIRTRCVYFFNLIWLNSDVVGAILHFMNDLKDGTDLTEMTYLAPCAMLSVVGIFKSTMKNKIEKDEGKFVNCVITLLNIFNICVVFDFTFTPIIKIVKNYMSSGEIELVLPHKVVYPFDPFDIKYWPFAFFKQSWSECIVLLEMCGADYFYYICCTFIRIQFRLLCYEFENLIQSHHKDHNIIGKRLKKLIQWHQDLIKCTSTLDLIYSKSTLFNFVSSSVIICLAGFNVKATDNIALAVTFLTFLSMNLFQIFFLCLFGDMIMRSSMDVSDAAYNCLWYADRNVARDVFLVQIRAQNPCKLTAFGFADVNFMSFSRIMSTSWSYFALLNTIYCENQEN